MQRKLIRAMLAMVTAVTLMLSGVQPTLAYGYNTNLLTTTKLVDGSGKTLSYQQTISLSAADIIRANKGDLFYVANAHEEANGSRTVTTSLGVICQDQAGNWLQPIYSDGDKRYWVAHARYDYNSGEKQVPVGTTQITYMAGVSIGTSGDLELSSMSLILKDTVKPAYSSTSLAAINNVAIPVSGSVAGTYPAGTKLRYAVKFDEPVVVTSSGTFNVSLSGTASAATYKEQSSDRMILYYDYTIPTSGVVSDNAYVRMSAIAGLVVRDDAGNVLAVDKSLSDGYGLYMDNKPPQVSSFTTTASGNACYKSGDTITFNVYFHEPITVSGSPAIALTNGKQAVYQAGSGSQTDKATFVYTVGSADNNTDALGISSVNFSGVKDKVNQPASYNAQAYSGFLTSYKLKIDTHAPTVTASDPGAGWHDRNYQVAITASDASGSESGSGVEELSFVWTTDPGNAAPTFPLAPNIGSDNTVPAPAASGIHYLWVKAVDRAGNQQASKLPSGYRFDLEGPTVTITPRTLPGYPALASVAVQVTDSRSGMASQTYAWIDGGLVTVASGSLDAGLTYPGADGRYTLVVTAIDAVGNRTVAEAKQLVIDQTPPTVTFQPTSGPGFQRAYSASVNLSDSGSGVASYAYQWTTSPERPAGGFIPTTLTAFTTPSGVSGGHYLQICSTDGAGNVGYATSGVYNLDNAPPTIAISPNGNDSTIGSNQYEIGVSVQDAVTLTADLTVHYAFSQDQSASEVDWQPLTGSTLQLSQLTATTYLHVRAVDALGNTALFTSAPFIADISAPTGSIGNCSGDYLRAAPVQLEFAARDDYAVEADLEMQLTVDGVSGDWVSFVPETNATFLVTEGLHTISVKYRDLSGNVSPTYATSFTVDLTPPLIAISYQPAAATSGAVTATASTNLPDELTSASSHLFAENGSFTFTARDLAGNTATQTAVVTWIDQTAPTVSFASADFDNEAHQTVAVTLAASDNANGIAALEYRFLPAGESDGDWVVTSSGETVTLGAVDGKYYLEARATDGVGNQAVKRSAALYLDNTAPSGSLIFQSATRTAQPVLASLTLDEPATITNNEGKNSYLFQENGSFSWQFVDHAGNAGSLQATVDWIDRTVPTATITVTGRDGQVVALDQWVNHDLLVTISPSVHAALSNLTWNGQSLGTTSMALLHDAASNTFLVSGYGVLGCTVRDLDTGLERQVSFTAKIDKIAPLLQSERRSPELGWTNRDVIVTITAEDTFSTVSYLNGNTHTFSANGSHTFYFTDALGNQGEHTVTVSDIDKSAPVASVAYTVNGATYAGLPTNQSVLATISLASLSPASVQNNGGSLTYTFSENGEFVFQLIDAAGNTGVCTVSVAQIDKTPPTISFLSSQPAGQPHQSVAVTVNAEDDGNGLASLHYRWLVGGVSGGEWVACTSGETVTLGGVDGQYQLEVLAEDGVGNQLTRRSEMYRLDNTAPLASIQYQPSSRTARDVTAEISFNEPATVLNNPGTTHLFTDNGSFTFEYRDEAGNSGTLLAVVNWIDRELPEATLALTDTSLRAVAPDSWVSHDLLATLTPPVTGELSNLAWNGRPIEQASGISLVDAASGTYLVTEYGLLTFTVRDLVTALESDGAFTMRIDKTPPVWQSARHSPEGWTNGQVTVSIVAEDALSPVTYLNGQSHVFTANGSHTFYFQDAAGNQAEYTADVGNIDTSLPVASITYSVNGAPYAGLPTNQDVTATIHFHSLSPVTVQNNGGSQSHTFTANGEFTFRFVNAAGGGSLTASVAQIDKTPPLVGISSSQFDGQPHQAVQATITAADAENGLASLEYRFASATASAGDWFVGSSGQTVELAGVDGSYRLEVRARDGVGNQTLVQSELLQLDNTPPLASVHYQPSTRTAQNVQASLSLNEAATITSGGGSSVHVFTDNGSFTFEFVDQAGNSGSMTAAVNWIDRSIPEALVALRDLQNRPVAIGTWVKHDLLATIAPRANAEISLLTWNGQPLADASGVSLHDAASHTYLVTTNGTFRYSVRDTDTGLVGDGTLAVKIDKQAPVVKSERRTPESWTNGDVTVTIVAEDALTSVTYQNGNAHTFTENGSYTFRFLDAVGNAGEHTVTVDQIDKTPPQPTVAYTVQGEAHGGDFTNQDVVATISFDSLSPVTVLNNASSRVHTFAANGAFTFDFSDAAGNSGSYTATVDCIDKTAPTAYVSYSTERWTNQDVLAILHVSDEASGAANDGVTFTFQANGTHQFTAFDRAGNSQVVTASVTRIDKTPPKLSYALSPGKRTPYSVFATVSADESVTWQNNGGRPSLQFDSNGSFTFRARDRAGNVSEILVVVENINKQSTPVRLAYSQTEPTKDNVYVTIAPEDQENEIILVLNNGGSATRVFRENGEFVYSYRNPAGIAGTAMASVSNIDKLAPVVEVAYSTTELTNGSVTVTLSADEPVVWPFGVKDGILVLQESSRLQLPVADKVGNVTNALIEVSWIDITPPVISLAEQYQAIALGTRFDALAGVTVQDEHPAQQALAWQGTVNTQLPGDYTVVYTATDAAGNTATASKYVTVYDPRQFNVIINGRMPVNGEVEIQGGKLQLTTINQEGKLKLLCLPGKKGSGDFKLKGNPIDQEHTFSTGGYYTLYLQDEERHTQLVYLFVK